MQRRRPKRRATTIMSSVIALLLIMSWQSPALGQDDARLRGAAIQIKGLQIDADARNTDVRGVSVSFQYRVGRVASDKALFLIAYLNDGQGKKIGSAVDDWAFHDRDMHLHGKTQLLTVPRYAWQNGRLFLPFYAMKLSPGQHQLSMSFEGVSPAQSCKSGGRPQRIEVVGENTARVDLVKPPFKMVQMVVRRVSVAEKSTDALYPSRKARPDLAWKAFFQLDLHKGKVHSSKTRDDRYSGTWNQYSQPFPFSEGDQLSLTVIDRDVLSHDLLGTFSLSLDELSKSSASPLSDQSVKSLVLGPVKVR